MATRKVLEVLERHGRSVRIHEPTAVLCANLHASRLGAFLCTHQSSTQVDVRHELSLRAHTLGLLHGLTPKTVSDPCSAVYV
jgi:hypothetical protein